MQSSTRPCNGGGSHGGARSVLCWEQKLAQKQESTIMEFLHGFNCGCKCQCAEKIRALGEVNAVKIVRDLRTSRLAGTIHTLLTIRNCTHKPR